MSENRRSIFYLLAIGVSFAVFATVAIGLFLPLVNVGGEGITIYQTIHAIIEFFADIQNININKVLKITSLIRNTIVISLAISLLIHLIISFLKFLFKNIRNIVHANDFYGEDLISVCVHVAVFSMTMYAYYPYWDYAAGLTLMTIGAVAGIVIVSLLRLIEGLKSDEKLRGAAHAILMCVAALFLFTTIAAGMHSPVAVEGSTGRIAIVEEFTNYFTNVFLNFSKEVIVALILEIVALSLLFSSFTYLGTSIQFTLGCVKKSRKIRVKHQQKEYHFRAILRALIGLAALAGSIVLIVIKSKEAFGVQFTIGRTGIVSFVLIVAAIILIVIAKIIKPKVNTYDRAEEKEAEKEKALEEKVLNS